MHYGDQIPEQYACKDREVINPQGLPVKHLDGQKSADQLETAVAEARRLASDHTAIEALAARVTTLDARLDRAIAQAKFCSTKIIPHYEGFYRRVLERSS